MSRNHPIWDDPEIKAALSEGRAPDDICVLNCSICGGLGYYNQGTSFYCRYCQRGFTVLDENEEPPPDDARSYFWPDVLLTLDDVIAAECEDY